ncbi:MAG: U32 family peptidase [Alistipes sp.]
MKKIELLAPAKDLKAAMAAVDYGADAIYIGGARFGARRTAGNSIEDIAQVVAYAHRFGVRVYCTLNTLVYDAELAEAETQARELIATGIDALIVQDMAFRRMNLPIELHASTQMWNASPEKIVFLEKCGFARTILERALSLNEIRAIRAATTHDLECFIHGAICVGYSGRCFLSRSMTADRSGNRGVCSQPCRLTWDLVDEQGQRIIERKHLLSVRDLNLSAHLGELIDAGVTSFKIEGRLKEIDYIKNVVAYYRELLDRILAKRPDCVRSSVGESQPDFTPNPIKSFTRGESDYFFSGKRVGVTSFDTPKSIGEFLGRVERVEKKVFHLDRPVEVTAGDGLCFLTPNGLSGTNVNGVNATAIEPNRMDNILPGVAIYRNDDHRFNLSLERSRTRRVIPVKAEVRIARDRAYVRFEDAEGASCEVVREGAFELAKDAVKMIATIRSQMMKSGETLFDVREVNTGDGHWFVPVSLLAEIRREGLEKLLQKREQRQLSHQILPEELSAIYPSTQLMAEENVTNKLAEQFYRDHGVTDIEQGFDLGGSTVGRRVMCSAYCIRREIGACLRERPSLKEPLYLVRGAFRYRLEFDCKRCEMSLIDAKEEKKK